MAFDSKEYGWKDISVNVTGQNMISIEEIKYKYTRSTEFRYGKGGDPHDIERGNRELTGEIVITQNELDKLTQVSPNRDISALDHLLTVAYAKTTVAKQTVDQLVGVVFEEVEKGMAQGDKHASIRIPFKFLKLVEGI
jgi:phage tail tube protein FII